MQKTLNPYIKKLKTLVKNKKAPFLLGAFISMLAFIGFFQIDDNSIETIIKAIIEAFYKTFGLFGGNYSFDNSTNIFLYIASFFAPIVVLGTFFIIFFRHIKEFFFFSFSKSSYILILGAGDLGKVLAKDILAKDKKNLVIIEKDESNPNIQKLRDEGAIVLVGDASNSKLLKNINIHRTEEIFCLTGDDLTNLKIFSKLKYKIKETSLYIHLENDEKYELLNKDTNSNIKDIKIFNIYSNTAQVFFDKNPLLSSSKNHLAIIGFDTLGKSLLYRALNLGHFYNENEKIKVTIFDKNFKDKQNEFFKKNPNILDEKYKSYWEINFKDELELFTMGYIKNFDKIIFTKTNMEESVCDISSLIKTQAKELIENQNKIFIYASTYKQISSLLYKNDKISVNSYGFLEDICSYDIIKNESLDKMAKITNYYYNELHGYNTDNKSKEEQWKALDHFLKDSNRMQVEHLKTKVSMINTLIKDKTNLNNYEDIKSKVKEKYFNYPNDEILWDKIEGAKNIAMLLSLDEIEKLAKMEKKRWNAFHILNAWRTLDIEENTRQKIQKDKEKKLHPCLVEWSELDKVSQNHKHNYKSDDIETIMRSYAMIKTANKEDNTWIDKEENTVFKEFLLLSYNEYH